MNESLFLASIASDLAKSAQETGQQFGWHFEMFLAQCFSFAIVAFLLHRFAYQPILRALEERRQRIAESVANAERIKQELATTESARREVLAKAGQQATQLIEEARAAAARVQEQETQRAVAAAEQIIAKAREAAAADHARMLAELRREVGRLVVQTTAKVAGKVLTADDQRRLVEEANKELAA